jgi:mannonate dehydratase
MVHCWRWFGPDDPVTLSDIRQAGATGIVTALHEADRDMPWSPAGVASRRKAIDEVGGSENNMSWRVVESIPVHPSIMTGSPERDRYIDVFIDTMRTVAAADISVVCYNFMPLLDWSRTDLAFGLSAGSKALRFDWNALAAFDLHILNRRDADSDYSEATVRAAGGLFRSMTPRDCDNLTKTILAGLPGTDRSYSIGDFRNALAVFDELDATTLRQNLIEFQASITPVANDLELRLAIHPDDPPFPILGLPRVVSTEADLTSLFEATPSKANGLTLCTGSLGARPDNDLVAIARRYADRTHFVHLRNVRREDDRTFVESEHLDGEVDMFEVVRVIVEEEDRRRSDNRPDQQIPMRPDHGHQMLDDLAKTTNPGYSAIGRLKGLAELRGLELGIRRSLKNLAHAD